MAETKVAAGDDQSEIARVPTEGADSVIEKVAPSGDTDPALAVTGGEIIYFSPEEEKSVLSKIDWHIIPLMCWI